MNERIRELAEQANKQIRHRICPNTFKPIDDPNGPHIRIEFDKEKFAELIVRECINTSEQHAKSLEAQPCEPEFTQYEDGIVNGIYEATAAIKEHFGVQE